MVGRMASKVLVTLSLQILLGVSAIQNDRTSSRPSREDIILSASAYTGPERTSSVFHRDGSQTFQRTVPAFQLESSKSINGYDKDDARFEHGNTRHVESIDELTSSKHVDHIDGNNIEVKPGEYYHISPTTSESMSGEGQGAPQRPKLLSEPRQMAGVSNQQAHYLQAIDQQRRARQETPRIYSEHAPPPILQTASPGHRQANPDIQDIITGIVKLLNGNVNVAANTVRPLRPIQATRINNRGPPRISDVPPLPPDFDTPGMNPPPPPDHPYPFEKPPAPDRPMVNQLPPERPIRPFVNGVPLPEQIVPQGNRPWTWNRPGGNRRPISPYKPLPPSSDSTFNREKEQDDKHSDKPQADLNSSTEESTTRKEDTEQNETATSVAKNTTKSHEENNNKKDKVDSKTTEKPINEEPAKGSESQSPAKKENKHQFPYKENKVNIESTSPAAVQPSHDDETITNHGDSPKPVMPLESPIKPTKTLKINDSHRPSSSANNGKPNSKESIAKTSTKSYSTSTLNIETSSSVQIIELTTTKTMAHSTASQTNNGPNNTGSTPSTVALEPSKSSVLESTIASSIATPTENLPSTFTRTTSTTSEKSIVHTPVSNTFSKNSAPTDRYAYRPRPGIVLDDTLDYTGSQGLATQRPYAPPRHPPLGDIFDVTVSAIQGPGGGSGEGVRVPVNAGGNADVILTSAVEGQGFVSIDGKRTYLNLFENSDRTSTHVQTQPQPTRTQAPPIVGTGFAIAQPDPPTATPRPSGPIRRPTFQRRPTPPPVRIDTCIVGDTSTCDISQHEACATVQGVSACHCKPGFARLQHSLPCKKIISIVVSIRVDKIYDRKVVWDRGFTDRDSEPYQTLAYEANRAIESAMSMTPFSDEYMGSFVNGLYQGDVSQGQGGVFVNATLKLTYEPRTIRPNLAGELQRHLLGVIHRRSNNIGNSALYVESPAGSISNLQDLDECASSELNDCHSSAICTNNWGGFTCTCNTGLKDPHKDDLNESGRTCISCPSTYCNNRGSCSYQGDHMQCTCTGNYYGAQCEVDGEVLGVAIGASVAALIIIVLTLVCLVMWSRRWSREQKSVGSPVYGYIQGGIPGTLPGTLARVGSVGTLASVKQGPPTNLPPYMWAHFGDHMATANVYATEPMGPTRPSSAVFGYPPINVHGTLPPVPLPRLQAPTRPRQRHQPDPDSSDSEPQDKDRADLIPQHSGFHVPRPKSRSSLANQSGIYNDVEYDQGDVHHLSKNNIPMSTYRPYYRT
ncbi:calcium-binding EGF-like domain-containing protein pawn isoform X2 [Xylocopa sonorina]|uniref:calcium-binding EGF-like domain-containing protein pawn isoform X2 n=1 Tax=Xylocopa sonorina TaxID=1818115 RepID=UPI00403A9742